VIEPEVTELIESPCSLIVASVDADGLPDAVRGWGVKVLGPDRVRVLLATNAERTLDNLAGGGRIALTTTHFVTAVSWQLKGVATSIEEATSADRICFDAYCGGSIETLHLAEGSAPEVIARLMPVGILACEMTVEQVFDQTPGPGAGARVAPVAS
jgi:predicted pyridoxine 5'-phosphate oxidase superfamily flavin-nucleotide-binding protein